MLADFRDKRVTVMGLGSFGGGIGAVRYLAERGAQITVTDLKPAQDLWPACMTARRFPGVYAGPALAYAGYRALNVGCEVSAGAVLFNTTKSKPSAGSLIFDLTMGV